MLISRSMVATALLVSVWAAHAHAHAILVESTPAPLATVKPGHEAVVLRFNSRIDRRRSRLTLIGADKAQAVLAVPDSGSPDQMTAAADLQPGSYVIRWQVLAVDGHITRGDLPFSVAP